LFCRTVAVAPSRSYSQITLDGFGGNHSKSVSASVAAERFVGEHDERNEKDQEGGHRRDL
jgi:hypothetical protein